jgi:hypothetical protein
LIEVSGRHFLPFCPSYFLTRALRAAKDVLVARYLDRVSGAIVRAELAALARLSVNYHGRNVVHLENAWRSRADLDAQVAAYAVFGIYSYVFLEHIALLGGPFKIKISRKGPRNQVPQYASGAIAGPLTADGKVAGETWCAQQDSNHSSPKDISGNTLRETSGQAHGMSGPQSGPLSDSTGAVDVGKLAKELAALTAEDRARLRELLDSGEKRG